MLTDNDVKIEINILESEESTLNIEGYVLDSNNMPLSNQLLKLVKVKYSNMNIKDEIITSCLSDKLGFYKFNKKIIKEDLEAFKIIL